MVSLKDSTATQPDSLAAFADEFGPAVQSKLAPFYRQGQF